MRRVLPFLVVLFASAAAVALTIHRSFRPTPIPAGGGTAVVVPGLAPRESIRFTPPGPPAPDPKRLERKVLGTVTGLLDADSVWVLPPAGTRQKVHLERIVAPKKDEKFGDGAKRFLHDLVFGKKVEVHYTRRDSTGAVIGTVFLKHEKGLVDVNLTMVRNGAARLAESDDTPEAYARSEAAAKDARLGVWAD